MCSSPRSVRHSSERPRTPSEHVRHPRHGTRSPPVTGRHCWGFMAAAAKHAAARMARHRYPASRTHARPHHAHQQRHAHPIIAVDARPSSSVLKGRWSASRATPMQNVLRDRRVRMPVCVKRDVNRMRTAWVMSGVDRLKMPMHHGSAPPTDNSESPAEATHRFGHPPNAHLASYV